MAGQGPAPKPATERRRRNKTDEQTLPAEGYQGKFPALPTTWQMERVTYVKDPETGDKEPVLETVRIKYLKPTRDWYLAWARSPMATEFTAVDWNRLQRIARLVDMYERRPAKELLAEIRLQEAGFGGTPLDRRRLGRTIEPTGNKQPQRPPSRQTSNRRARLTVVK